MGVHHGITDVPGAVHDDGARQRIVVAGIESAEADRSAMAADNAFADSESPLFNAVLTPHFGYSALEVYAEYYRHTVENVLAFLDGKPIRVLELPKP